MSEPREAEVMRTEYPECQSMYFGVPAGANIDYCCIGLGCSLCRAASAYAAQHEEELTMQLAMLFFVGVAAVAEEMMDEHEVTA
jgi:hypothetical protein